MDDSRLATLPAELRNEIWELALTQDKPIVLGCSNRRNFELSRKQKQREGNMLSLTQTCQAIRAECKLLFFNANTFDFRLGDIDLTPRNLRSFIATIGTTALSAMGKVTFTTNFTTTNCSGYTRVGYLIGTLCRYKAIALAGNIRKFYLIVELMHDGMKGSFEIDPAPNSGSWDKAHVILEETIAHLDSELRARENLRLLQRALHSVKQHLLGR